MRIGPLEFSGTRADTPLGELRLHRRRLKKDAFGLPAINGPEEWSLSLADRPLAELPAFELHAARGAKLRRGAAGGFEGAELRITVRGGLRRSRRRVEFHSGGRTLCFVRRGLARAELLEDGRAVARSSLRGWEQEEADPLRVLALAVYTWANLDRANANPVLRNLLPAVLGGLLS
ncbi:hypothetical protein [Kitasatospora fiedleri]|uniref:hypothetical protein n=1 Tax=Kitasatospora fiedleri TaxID=2991545 RepID=UPI00249A2BCB|nr:hypothetical protein [Kitasatospora fiedleri]